MGLRGCRPARYNTWRTGQRVAPPGDTRHAGHTAETLVDTAARWDPTALRLIAELCRQCGLPAVAVGGVSAENAAAIMRFGASGLVVISALLAANDPTQAARALRDAQGAIES